MSTTGRMVGVAVLTVVAAGSMVVTGMGPRWLVVVPLIVAIGSLLSLVGEAQRDATTTMPEPDTDTDVPWAVFDPRIWSLRIALMSNSAERRRRLHENLVELIDDQLVVAHGVDRRSEPVRARAILGDELHDFVTTSDPANALRSTARVERIVSGIERL